MGNRGNWDTTQNIFSHFHDHWFLLPFESIDSWYVACYCMLNKPFANVVMFQDQHEIFNFIRKAFWRMKAKFLCALQLIYLKDTWEWLCRATFRWAAACISICISHMVAFLSDEMNLILKIFCKPLIYACTQDLCDHKLFGAHDEFDVSILIHQLGYVMNEN